MTNLFNRLGGAVRAGLASFRAHGAYEGATQGRRGKGWVASSAGPNAALNPVLGTLRKRTLQGYRNNPWLERAIERNVVNEVGVGITPVFGSSDTAFNEACETLWPQWVAQSGSEGALNFYGQLVQAVRARRVAGEVFIRRRPRPTSWGLAVPFQLQVIDAAQVPTELNERLRNGNRIVAGKEYNKKERLVAIWVLPEHPTDGQTNGYNRPIRIRASEIIHHYLPLWPGQVRGEPDPVQALLRAKTYDSYEDAELTRKETRAPYTGFLKKEYEGEDDWAFDPITGEPVEDGGALPEINAQPGTIIAGTHGESLTLFDGDNTGAGYSDYQRQQLLALAAGAKSLYELTTGDWSKVNDRTYRAMITEYRREIQMAQDHLCIHQICERVGRWFTDGGVLTGVLPVTDYATNYADYNTREWSPHRWPHIHPTQDIATIAREMELDLTSHDAEAAKRGKKGAEIQRKNVAARKRKQDLEAEQGLQPETGDTP